MIALIGSGNVAHWVAGRLRNSQEFPVGQVYSRRMENARALADILGAEAIDDLSLLRPDCDIYLFSVKDDAWKKFRSPFLWHCTRRALFLKMFSWGTPASTVYCILCRHFPRHPILSGCKFRFAWKTA